MHRTDRWISYLRQRGFRCTHPRQRVVQEVLKRNAPFTAEELYAEMKQSGVGRATVFRTLRLLQELGMLVRVHLEDGCQHYQVAPGEPTEGKHHDRIICRVCGEIDYLDECPLKEDVRVIAKRAGYRIDGHHQDLYGICSLCDEEDR